jgi:phytanoyl-CoA hydroxylase
VGKARAAIAVGKHWAACHDSLGDLDDPSDAPLDISFKQSYGLSFEKNVNQRNTITMLQELSPSEFQSFYQKNGYVVVRNLIPHARLDAVLHFYQNDIVTARHPFFRQNTYTYEKSTIDQYGHIKESFLDVHNYKKYPDFSNSIKDVLCSLEMRNTLSEISGFETFNLMQGMLFDANTATFPHQEWWYLDSIPHGHLTIAWIALEDIAAEAGRFYVMAEAEDNQDFRDGNPEMSHGEWAQRIRDYVDANLDRVIAPDLRKGDVLFFNSKVIHGSLPTQDPRFSRKSLTAHYLPAQFEFGNLFKARPAHYQTYKGMRYHATYSDYSPMRALQFQLRQSIYNTPWLHQGVRSLLNAVKRS